MRLQELDPVSIYILVHLHRANIDYARSIAKMASISQREVEERLTALEDAGLVERVHGSAVKRNEARFKLSYEVHKHHTYYTLTKSGKHLVRELRKGGFENYLSEITGFERGFQLVNLLNDCGCEHVSHIARLLSAKREDVSSAILRLKELKLITECRGKIIKRKNRKGKPKKETRTHHTYYTTTRLAEMLFRHLR